MRRLGLAWLLFGSPLIAQGVTQGVAQEVAQNVAPRAALPVVTSHEPASVAVTLYRGHHDENQGVDLAAPAGYALITETREVELPPGVVTLRFEGVSSGIEPVSALVTGVPVHEKNRDRRLLSQRGLLDAFTGQAVTIRRTNKATGKVTEEPGTIRSAPDNLILQTKAGYEAVQCSGLNQTLVFPDVPADLTAKPTLSVTTVDQPGGKQIITLSYLASGFDWHANYVAELADDASHLDLLGWLTMASSDDTSYPDARTNAVAGKVFHDSQSDSEVDPEARSLADAPVSYSCWPMGSTTSDLSYAMKYEDSSPVYDLPASAAPAVMMKGADIRLEEIVVTEARKAAQEDLGDLKLYRIPFAVTVAAHSQKQVAFLSKQQIKGELLYRTRLQDNQMDDDTVELLYRLQNTTKTGLGEPLPSGKVAVFQQVAGQRMLVGEASVDDKAVGEDIDLVLAEGSNVTVDVDEADEAGPNWAGGQLVVTNANPFSITYEAELPNDNEEIALEKFSPRITIKKGKRIWRTTVPANNKRILKFRAVNKTN